MNGNLSYEDYIIIFLTTIIFSVIGILLFVVTNHFMIIFVSIIPGILIDMLKFAAKIYYSKLSEGTSRKREHLSRKN